MACMTSEPRVLRESLMTGLQLHPVPDRVALGPCVNGPGSTSFHRPSLALTERLVPSVENDGPGRTRPSTLALL